MRRALLFASFLVLAACSKSEDPASKPGDSGSSSQPTVPPANAKPPLTQADIDLYVALTRDKAPMTEEGQKAKMERHKTTTARWGDLYTQVKAAETAYYGVTKRNVPVPAHLAGDVELIKKNIETIEAAEAGK
jgi:hypothetical protein